LSKTNISFSTFYKMFKRKIWQVIVIIGVVLSVLIILLTRYKLYAMPTTSMESTIKLRSKFWIDTWETKPTNNDLIVFKHLPNEKLGKENKSSFIHRCIATAGDKIEIKDGQLFVNDKKATHIPGLQFSYLVKSKNGISQKKFAELGISEVMEADVSAVRQTDFKVFIDESKANELKNLPSIVDIQRIIRPKGEFDEQIFPQYKGLNWNVDNYGPLQIPQKGLKISINALNLAIYGSLIQNAEGNKNVIIKDSSLLIENQPITEYIFKENYCFVMGDNRHNALDSRYLGFVAQKLIQGKVSWILD
jgi:signal peptidase I